MNWRVLLILLFTLLAAVCAEEINLEGNDEITETTVAAEDTTLTPSLIDVGEFGEVPTGSLPAVPWLNNFAPNCRCGVAGPPAPTPFKQRQLPGFDIGEEDILDPSPLIIGGYEAGEHEFPWMVGMSKKGLFDPPGKPPKITCGATLISSRFLLTAAHCITNELTSRYELLFRTHNLTKVVSETKTSTSYLIVKAKRFIPHPQWDIKIVKNDIGLIELQKPIDFAKEPLIRPACLPTADDGDFASHNATAVGWGYTKPKGAMATVLQKVTVPVLSHFECQNTRYGTMVTPTMVCAGYEQGKKDACTNDSGGPLTVVSPSGSHKLIGVVSWGHGCANPNAPGVYTRVSKYLEWIRSVVKDSEWCRRG